MIYQIHVDRFEQKIKQQQAFDIGYKWDGDLLCNIKPMLGEYLYLNSNTHTMSEECDVEITPISNSIFYTMMGYGYEP